MNIDDKEFFDRIASKLDAISDQISEIRIIQKEQKGILDMHIYRTELAEKNIELIQKRLFPLETKQNYLDGSMKLVGVVSTVLGLIWIVFQLIKFLGI
jgi:hypothetical protein